ncbi:MAG: amino acid ABC transporter substrate-binding protein [Ilumatobacteraceae bacterium]
MRRTFIRTLVPLAAIALIAGACSDDDDATDSSDADITLAPEAEAGVDSVATGDTAADTTPADTAAAGPGSTADTAEEVQAGDSLLDTVKANGSLKCGVNDAVAGFSVVDDAGDYVGFDADFCRVIAAAVLGDATAVEFVPVAADARFPALQAGEIDVLVRNTTWTASRDGSLGATFLHPTFYDGQQMMVAADSGYTGIDDMDGAVVCVIGGTTTEGNVASEFAARGLTVQVSSFENVDLVQAAFQEGSCDGWSSDGSQLASRRAGYPDGPDSLVIFDDVFSKEPLTPAVIDGDTAWAQAVEWAIFATIGAEELGITSETAEADAAGDDAAKVLFLTGGNVDGTTLDPGLGLPTDYALQVVSQVGNYAEIFDANLGPIGIEDRGLNALWSDGGLQYSPPYR